MVVSIHVDGPRPWILLKWFYSLKNEGGGEETVELEEVDDNGDVDGNI
jgi:hypothetical protein